MATLEERFWAKVAVMDDLWDCWDWTAYRNPEGYGEIYIRPRIKDKAHRISFALSRGRSIGEGLEVMHLCDRPCCVNPVHLREGTHRDNMLDSWEKGRLQTVIQTVEMLEKQLRNTPRGERNWMTTQGWQHQHERNGNAKLTQEKVAAIRRLREEEGLTLKTLGEHFGVHLAMIGFIVRNECWVEAGQLRPKIVRPKRTELSLEKAREIRTLYAAGNVKQAALARQYRVSKHVINNLVHHRTWVEREEPPPAA